MAVPDSRLRRAGALALALAVAVAFFTLVLNGGGPERGATPEGADNPSTESSSTGTTGSTESPGGDAEAPDSSTVDGDALVTRMLADLRAGRKPESQDQPLAGAPVRLVRAGPDNPAPIAEMRIPAIDLRTPMFEGVYEDALLDGPGHWPGTPGFGEPGNTVISGHRSTETRPFLYLDRLTKGDVIIISRGNDQFRYAVDFVTIIPERRYVRYVTKQPTNPRARTVTLFACNPLTAHYQRIVVRGHALSSGSRA